MKHPNLESLTSKELKTLEANVRRVLESGAPEKRVIAGERLKLIADERDRRNANRRKKTSEFEWAKRVDRKYGPAVAYFRRTKVAEIRKDENHNSHNNAVYTLFIGDERLPERFRYLNEAKNAIETEFFRRLHSSVGA